MHVQQVDFHSTWKSYIAKFICIEKEYKKTIVLMSLYTATWFSNLKDYSAEFVHLYNTDVLEMLETFKISPRYV